MTEEQKFLFDLQGYIVVEKVLPPEQVNRMVMHMAEHDIHEPDNNPEKSRFDGFLGWGEEWRSLIDHPTLMPFLTELLGAKFRLDHAYGMAMRAEGAGGGEGLHHESSMFNHGCYYMTHGNVMHNGLIVVSYALTDAEPNMGGFACIPGSHKALYKMPKEWYEIEGNPLVRQIPQKAGDVLIFTEALTHGTMSWLNKEVERRSVLLKYCPNYMQWVEPHAAAEVDGLTERQKLILQPAYVNRRPEL